MNRILCPDCKEQWILPDFPKCRKCRRKAVRTHEHKDYLKRRVAIAKRNMARRGQVFGGQK
jgi:hypothetical protein